MKNDCVMYNRDQKEEYIKHEKINSTGLTNYFKRLSKKEYELNKDIADMNVDELKLTFMSLYIRREETIGHMISLIRGYINWAILNGKSKSENAIDKITTESVFSKETIRLQMIKSPEHLESILDSTLDEENYQNRTIRDSLVFWLIYSGIDIKDLEDLQNTDIDIEKGVVKVKNIKSYEVYKQVVDLWNQCTNITFLERRNSKSIRAEEYSKYYLEDSNYLFRPVITKRYNGNGKCNLNTFINITSKIINSYANKNERVKIPPANIRNSGIFYKLLLLERQGVEISNNLLADYLEINNSKNNKDNLFLLVRKWRIDYEDWKLAFEYTNQFL